MKIEKTSDQSFKAFEFSDKALELMQRRYKSAGERLLHENLTMDQHYNPVHVKFDTNKKGNALTAQVSVITNAFQYCKKFKEGLISRFSSPKAFITKMYNKANIVRNELDNAEAFKESLDNFNNSKSQFKL